ncbi:MAG: PRC-barrel domain-containing protein [Halobacteriota archaeon]
MVKGLDVGTVNIVFAEKQKGSAAFARQRNAYLEIDDTELTRAMFDSARVLFMEKNGKTLVLGEDAVKLASILKKEVMRPIRYGVITPDDKDSLSMLKVIVEKIVPPAEDNEIMCISSLARLIDSHIDIGYHRKTLKAMAKKWGYEVTQIDKGLAVIYSELGKHGFTGVGINVGAGYTTVTIAHRASPIASFSLAKGSDWIEKEAAAATGLSKFKINSIREDNFSLNSSYEVGSVEGALTIYYEALINYITTNLHKELTGIDVPQSEFPVVIAGNTALTDGFVELFKEKLSESELPINISSVNRAKEPVYTVARGCLISALTQSASRGKASTKTGSQYGTGAGTGAQKEPEPEAGTRAGTDKPVRSRGEPKRIRLPSRTGQPPEKILARSMANIPCVSSDGVVVGTVHNFTVDMESGSLKDLWIKPNSSSFLKLNTYSGLYVIPFENVSSTADYIVIKTLKVE